MEGGGEPVVGFVAGGPEGVAAGAVGGGGVDLEDGVVGGDLFEGYAGGVLVGCGLKWE